VTGSVVIWNFKQDSLADIVVELLSVVAVGASEDLTRIASRWPFETPLKQHRIFIFLDKALILLSSSLDEKAFIVSSGTEPNRIDLRLVSRYRRFV
jgi:hypothetical protein